MNIFNIFKSNKKKVKKEKWKKGDLVYFISPRYGIIRKGMYKDIYGDFYISPILEADEKCTGISTEYPLKVFKTRKQCEKFYNINQLKGQEKSNMIT